MRLASGRFGPPAGVGRVAFHATPKLASRFRFQHTHLNSSSNRLRAWVNRTIGVRSLFNGLAQIIVQSTKAAGEIKLTATADGLAPATTTVNTQPCTLRPFVP